MKHFARGFKSFLETTRHHKNGNGNGNGRSKSHNSERTHSSSSSSASTSSSHTANASHAPPSESLRSPTGAFHFSHSNAPHADDDPLRKAAADQSAMNDLLAVGVHTSHDGRRRRELSPAKAKSDEPHSKAFSTPQTSEPVNSHTLKSSHVNSDSHTSSRSGRPPDEANTHASKSAPPMSVDLDDEPLPTLPSPVAPPQQFSDSFSHTGNVAGGTPHGMIFPEDFELRALEGILRYVSHVQNSWYVMWVMSKSRHLFRAL